MSPASPPLFTGVGVAMASLFDDRERLLVDEVADLAAKLVADGVRAVVVAGTTGEPWFLTTDERCQLTSAVRDAVPDTVPVITGTGHDDQAEAVRMTEAVRDAGADAVIARSPRGVEDPTAYYTAVAEAAGELPVLAYHFPMVSPPGVPVDALAHLPIRGIKDTSGDVGRLAAELAAYDGPVYVGSPLLLATAGAFGAAGAIVAPANFVPERCSAAFAGDLGAQRALLEDHRAVAREFPRSLKTEIAERYGTPTGVRTRPPA